MSSIRKSKTSTGRFARRFRVLGAMMVGSLALTACDFDVYSLPLPGGADVGDNPISVSVEFEDVLDLVPQSSVKVNDISVGQITDIELTGQTALVTLELRADTQLPANTVATIRQTSLLGEKFVSLDAPTSEAPVGTLEDDDEIPLDRTGANPDVEEVLGALSLLLNGGGLPQLRTIAQEINLALEGREESAKSLLRQVDVFMGQLAANKGDIVQAIESINRLALGVRAQQTSIDRALEELPASLNSLNRQRDDLVRMLTALDNLSDVGVRVINRSKDVTIETFRQLQPLLTQLANAGDDLVNSFSVLLTYPFVDEVVGRDPQVARNLQMGDYTNLSVQLELDFSDLTDLPVIPGIPCGELDPLTNSPLAEILNATNLCVDAQEAIADCINNPSFETCDGLPVAIIDAVCGNVVVPLPGLCGNRSGTKKSGPSVTDVIKGLGIGNLVTDLDAFTTSGGKKGGGKKGGGKKGNSGSGSGGGVLGGVLGGLGSTLNRPATGTQAGTQAGGATYGELMNTFDPGLTSLLTPGMVLR